MTTNKPEENIGSFYMGRSRATPKRRVPAGLLTAAALFVFAGILWYAYPKGAEKYSDMDVPVVQADAAPIRVEPTDPGGMEVPHQDSTAFDPLTKSAGTQIEKLLPAQEEPINKEVGIKAEKPKAATKVTPAKAATTKAAAIATGSVYVQLGSYRDVSRAKTDWSMLQKKHAELLGNLEMKTEKVDLAGKGTYYRLQAGKTSDARAKEICAGLKAANSVGCIVVR